MTQDDFFELGYLSHTHGTKGQLVLVIDADNPSHYKKMESIYLDISGKPVPFFVTAVRHLRTNEYLLTIEDLDSESAELLVSKDVYMPLSALPVLKKEQYYYHQLPGYIVEDEKLGNIGTINNVFDTGTQILIAFNHKNQEAFFPLHDDLVLRVDNDLKIMYTRLPDGLLDVYITENED